MIFEDAFDFFILLIDVDGDTTIIFENDRDLETLFVVDGYMNQFYDLTATRQCISLLLRLAIQREQDLVVILSLDLQLHKLYLLVQPLQNSKDIIAL